MKEITLENIGVMFGGNIPVGTEICVRDRGNGQLIVGKVKSCELHSYSIIVTLYNMHYEKTNDILDDLLPSRIEGTKAYSTSSHMLFALNHKQVSLQHLKPPIPNHDTCIVM